MSEYTYNKEYDIDRWINQEGGRKKGGGRFKNGREEEGGIIYIYKIIRYSDKFPDYNIILL